MKKLTQRLLIFFFGVPFFIVVIFFLPYYNHLCINLLAIIFSSMGAVEFSVMLSAKNLKISKIEAAILGALPPLTVYLIGSFSHVPAVPLLIPGLIGIVLSWLFISRIFSRALGSFINRLAAGLAVLLYPGILMVWIVRMSQFQNHLENGYEYSSILLIVFLCLVFACDSMAWAIGKLFGKNNRGIIPVSPNKSIAGFICGFAGSTIAGIGAVIIFPNVFTPVYSDLFPGAGLISGGFLGLMCGMSAVLGDLGESALKRSSGIKDSGSVIPGRGGVLDSIDSISLAAPGFYLVFSLLFDPVMKIIP